MKFPGLILLLYLVLAALSLTGVLFRGWASSEGALFGLPRGLAFVMVWVVLTPLALFAYEATRSGQDEEPSA